MIFLDVDGVVADFVTPVMQVFGSSTTSRDLPSYNISDHLGKPYDEIWEHPVVSSQAFWEELPKMPWADDLVEMLVKRGDVAFLTQPIRSPSCLAGKKAWLHRNYPRIPFFIGNKKVLLARPGLTLVDDYEKNVDGWRERGGHGVLFPAPYNARGWMSDPVPVVERDLL